MSETAMGECKRLSELYETSVIERRVRWYMRWLTDQAVFSTLLYGARRLQHDAHRFLRYRAGDTDGVGLSDAEQEPAYQKCVFERLARRFGTDDIEVALAMRPDSIITPTRIEIAKRAFVIAWLEGLWLVRQKIEGVRLIYLDHNGFPDGDLGGPLFREWLKSCFPSYELPELYIEYVLWLAGTFGVGHDVASNLRGSEFFPGLTLGPYHGRPCIYAVTDPPLNPVRFS